MKFRTKLIFLVVGVIIIPILVTAMVGYLRWFISSSDPSLSPAGFFEIRRWILKDLPEELKEGYSASLRSSLPPKPGVIVFDLEDRILVSNIPGYEAGTRINPEKLLKSMIVEEGVRIAFEPLSIDGQRAGTVLLKLPENIGKLSGWSALHEHFITPLLALVIFSTVMVTVILNSLNRSIVYLERATKKITDGELDFELRIKGRDEISSLTRSFETMRRALKGELEKRSRFLMGVSHDLKTPLTAIEGYLEAISDGLAADPAVLKRYLTIITEKSKVLDSRITELIDFVKMETGEWKLRQERINLLSFLNRIARIYQEDASVLKREFNSRIKIPPDIKIEADSNLLNRALENLFNNALRFTRESDSIYLTAHLKNGEVLISIEDTGPGLTEAEIKLIFEPFYRGTSSRREQGFGLGLSIVKSIINAHGWEIKADSRPGDGTRFTIHIRI